MVFSGKSYSCTKGNSLNIRIVAVTNKNLMELFAQELMKGYTINEFFTREAGR